MSSFNCIDISSVTFENAPFPNFYSITALEENIGILIFEWFENTRYWNLIETDFYEQYEFNLLEVQLPSRWLNSCRRHGMEQQMSRQKAGLIFSFTLPPPLPKSPLLWGTHVLLREGVAISTRPEHLCVLILDQVLAF